MSNNMNYKESAIKNIINNRSVNILNSLNNEIIKSVFILTNNFFLK